MRCRLTLESSLLPVPVRTHIEPVKKKKKLSEFEQALIIARNKVKETTDKVNERQRKLGLYPARDRAIIQMDIQIRDMIQGTEQAINDLDKSLKPLRKERLKNSDVEEELQQKEKLVELIKDQFWYAKAEFEGEPIEMRDIESGQGLSKQRNELINMGHEERPLTSEEEEILSRFRTKDQMIDDMLILVIQDIDLLKEKAVHIDQAIERNEEKLHAVEKHATKVVKKLTTINTKMHDLVKKYAEPNRMCIYIILLVIALGLLLILYGLVKDAFSL
eukprot:TRINITY_DN9341_c0_g2_i1.p1 TRINITY_DN9341_c0_g2~~TRINITY_DN9341_c0_g2_i1.p1  ORF type:complete len:275 (-),score=80.49 TRINITY_DN9341_c0_g2_i1:62-886(-)